MRVEFSHHFADDARGLHMTVGGYEPHLGHLVQDAPLHRLQPVAGIRQRTGVDDGQGIVHIGDFHLLSDVNVVNALGAGCG